MASLLSWAVHFSGWQQSNPRLSLSVFAKKDGLSRRESLLMIGRTAKGTELGGTTGDLLPNSLHSHVASRIASHVHGETFPILWFNVSSQPPTRGSITSSVVPTRLMQSARSNSSHEVDDATFSQPIKIEKATTCDRSLE